MVAGRVRHPQGPSGGTATAGAVVGSTARGGGRRGVQTDPGRGWCLGEETFRQELLAQMNKRIGAEHFGEERVETAETGGGTNHRGRIQAAAVAGG